MSIMSAIIGDDNLKACYNLYSSAIGTCMISRYNTFENKSSFEETLAEQKNSMQVECPLSSHKGI